jgi:hypothetical protein
MSDETSADRVPKMLTLPEVAKALRCNVRSLYDSGWPKRLGAVKIGNKWLVPEVAVVEVLNGQRPARPQTLTLEGTTDSHREDTEQQVVADPPVVAGNVERLCAAAEQLISRGCCNKRGDGARLNTLHGWEEQEKALLACVTDREQLRRLRGLRLRVSRVIVSHYNEGHGRRTLPRPSS